MKACTWQKCHATGDLPEPHLAHALAVVNSKAYALVNDPEGTRRLEVYELDLETWVWRRVPPLGTQPSCRRAASAVVAQVSLIATGIHGILENPTFCLTVTAVNSGLSRDVEAFGGQQCIAVAFLWLPAGSR